MAAAVIEALFWGSETFDVDPDPGAVVIWFSDDPSLNEQTKDRLRQASEKFSYDQLVTVQPPFSRPKLEPHKVYFLNTQRLSKSSLLTRRHVEDENSLEFGPSPDLQGWTIWEFIANTIDDDDLIVYLILDEAHRVFNTRTAAEKPTIVRRLVNGHAGYPPIPIVWGISATIERFKEAMREAAADDSRRALPPIDVDPARVQESGLVKDTIVLEIPNEAGNFDTVLGRRAAEKLRDSSERWERYAKTEGLADAVPQRPAWSWAASLITATACPFPAVGLFTNDHRRLLYLVGVRTIGVAVGKFNPPHVGHLHLLLAAAAQVDDLYVVLADRPDQTIPAADRAGWLIEDLPDNVTILVTPDDLPPANEPWAERALEILPESPTVAFTSEPWGPGWAAAMGARHLSVDTERRTFPISASTIRSNLRAGFEWLIPAARASLARRVAIVGAESTGKTTLARALAHHYGTVWIPEYGRSYWEGRSHLVNQTWTTEEFRRIATTHHRVEADLACRAVQALVILDTDALVTVVWHRRYLGMDDGPLTDSADRQRPDLYLVCAPDFEWVQDGTRESGTQRADMHRRTLSLVEASGTPFLIVTGDPEARLEQAVRLIDPLITFPPLV